MIWIHERLRILAPALVLGLACWLKIADPTPLQALRLQVFDQYQRLKPRAYQSLPVKIIDVDDKSLEVIGQWPWPRTYIANLLQRLFQSGVAAVALDMVFAEPDRTSPRQILPMWPRTPEIGALREKADQLPDHDAILAEMIARTNVALGFPFTAKPGGRAPAVKWGIASAGDDPTSFLFGFPGAVPNLPELERAARGDGSFNIVPDPDNIQRRMSLAFVHRGQIYPSLVAEVLRIAQGASSYSVKSSGANLEESFGRRTGINHVKVGDYEIPTDARGRMWLYHSPRRPERSIAAWRVFRDEFPAEAVQGHVVFIGVSAAGLKDIRATPLEAAVPGVEIHAQALEQILSGEYLERPDWGEGAEFVFLIVLGGIVILLLRGLGAAWCAVVGVAAIGSAIAASWHLFSVQHFLIDPVIPSAAVLLVYLVGSLINFLETEREKSQVRSAFSQYLAPALVEQLAADPSRLRLGGETKEMTFLFCDVRGFTAASERFRGDPQRLTGLLNSFLTPMTEAILERGGTIDKYMGDCIMAFWNAPLDDPAHAEHACDSALAMYRELTDLNARIKADAEAAGQPYHKFDIGIGINTGTCVVGNMGSRQRFDYSVLGDAVNLASRLEGQTKTYGVGTVVGEVTRAEATGFAMLELDLVAVKGKAEAVRIFGLLGDRETLESPAFKELATRHDEMLAAYRAQNWADARCLMDACLTSSMAPRDLYELYRERIEAYELEPPGPDWDGVFIATTK